jgi:hypothetical protein
MANSPVAAKVHQTLDIHGNFSAKVTLDDEICNSRTQSRNLGFSKVLDRCMRCHTSCHTNLLRTRVTDAVNRRQADYDVLVQWNVYACYSSHFTPLLVVLALTLLMTFVSTNHSHNTVATNDFAVSAHFSY